MEIDQEEVTPERKERQGEIARSVESEAVETNKPVETKESCHSCTIGSSSASNGEKDETITTWYSLSQRGKGIEVSAFGEKFTEDTVCGFSLPL